ncbi:hypothetical protein GALMADRAFT_62556 [Galerina marginata CBS 339.88]|uniref:Protein rds1 n=1 Tax=Galerina marginata (strain CBS 339.88) TaxID=685588 RepID=A0A067TB22_GALM3|nr:hypothetical protein GALMADRAFT_62556 [Galerina marginata CBS 339.88]
MRSVFALILAAASVLATPVKRAIDDTTVLNFALTLEHLENAFYSGALAKFTDFDFLGAGLPIGARDRFELVAAHEAVHVKFLSDTLGSQATKPCTYNFPYTDPKSFAALSQVLEGVGASAYTGAAQLLTNKDFLTVAASILATEARHASWVASAVNMVTPWGTAFETPLGLNEVFTLAAGFITSCPSSNPALPVKAFPALTITGATPGQAASVSAPKATASPTFIAFFNGLDQIFAPVKNGKVTVPTGLQGQVYAVATTSGTLATDNVIVAGPAILFFDIKSTSVF